jgi:hypothetical protein
LLFKPQCKDRSYKGEKIKIRGRNSPSAWMNLKTPTLWNHYQWVPMNTNAYHYAQSSQHTAVRSILILSPQNILDLTSRRPQEVTPPNFVHILCLLNTATRLTPPLPFWIQ